LFFSADKALEARKRGDKAGLCKEQIVPSDTMVMSEIDAIVSLNPAAIHVVTACLSYGVPAFLNLEEHGVRLEQDALINANGKVIREGDWITVSSKYKHIYVGKARFIPARFQRFLEGEQLELSESDHNMFLEMKDAYKTYQDLVTRLTTSEISSPEELERMVRNHLKNEPVKAVKFMNSWYDDHAVSYVERILESPPGSHKNQHDLFNLLSIDRKKDCFDRISHICLQQHKQGFSAGFFMAGRFLSTELPVSFWMQFSTQQILFMFNEWILYQKYQQVLHEAGERNLNRATRQILTIGLGNIPLTPGSLKVFLPLKLTRPGWSLMEHLIGVNHDPQLTEMIILLSSPYRMFIDFSQPWSFARFEKLCLASGIPVPGEEEI
jgi:hypothetical protein